MGVRHIGHSYPDPGHLEAALQNVYTEQVRGWRGLSSVEPAGLARMAASQLGRRLGLRSRLPCSKTALNAMTLAMASELETTGIKVNAVSPGFTKTNLI